MKALIGQLIYNDATDMERRWQIPIGQLAGNDDVCYYEGYQLCFNDKTKYLRREVKNHNKLDR